MGDIRFLVYLIYYMFYLFIIIYIVKKVLDLARRRELHLINGWTLLCVSLIMPILGIAIDKLFSM